MVIAFWICLRVYLFLILLSPDFLPSMLVWISKLSVFSLDLQLLFDRIHVLSKLLCEERVVLNRSISGMPTTASTSGSISNVFKVSKCVSNQRFRIIFINRFLNDYIFLFFTSNLE